jgi:hypothetical protein
MGESDLGEEYEDEESFGRKPGTGGKEISRRGSSFLEDRKVVSKKQDRQKLREHL